MVTLRPRVPSPAPVSLALALRRGALVAATPSTYATLALLNNYDLRDDAAPYTANVNCSQPDPAQGTTTAQDVTIIAAQLDTVTDATP